MDSSSTQIYTLSLHDALPILATLFDEISCAAAAWVFGWSAVTGELTVRYQHPVPVETPLQWEARVTSTAHPRTSSSRRRCSAPANNSLARRVKSSGRACPQERSDALS